MKIKITTVIVICLLILLFYLNAQEPANKLRILTAATLVPYNYINNDGNLDGLSTEVVNAVLDRAEIKIQIEIFPWARAYDIVLNTPNTMLFTTNRTEQREKLFKWIGPIAPKKYSVYALKTRTDIKINTIQDLKKYIIGTTKDDAQEHYFISKGFKLDKNLDSIEGLDSNRRNMLKMINGRIDLWAIPDITAYHLARQEGYDPDKIFKKVLSLEEISKGHFYIAVNSKSNKLLIKKIQNALLEIKKDGTYDKILIKYGFNH